MITNKPKNTTNRDTERRTDGRIEGWNGKRSHTKCVSLFSFNFVGKFQIRYFDVAIFRYFETRQNSRCNTVQDVGVNTLVSCILFKNRRLVYMLSVLLVPTARMPLAQASWTCFQMSADVRYIRFFFSFFPQELLRVPPDCIFFFEVWFAVGGPPSCVCCRKARRMD